MSRCENILRYKHTDWPCDGTQTTRHFIVVDKDKQTADIALPGDVWVDKREQETTDKREDLTMKLRRLWKVIVVGVLGTKAKPGEKPEEQR